MQKLLCWLQQPKVVLGLLSLATILLLIGISVPIMTIKTLVFMRHSFSVLSGTLDLLSGGKYFLFLVIALFSLIFPLVKLLFLFAIVLGELKHNEKTQRYLGWLHDYGRWAMLDVFVVALLIVSLKLGAVASVQIHLGFYIFCAAVLLIMSVTHIVVLALGESHK